MLRHTKKNTDYKQTLNFYLVWFVYVVYWNKRTEGHLLLQYGMCKMFSLLQEMCVCNK
jgi:hypothetical protein